MVAPGTDGYRLSTKQKKEKTNAVLWRLAGHRAGLAAFLGLQSLWSPPNGRKLRWEASEVSSK